jgi:hypothetical protein
VLLYGPPGTGKTMLAKAVAHHTTAAFIRVVGSEFVQKYLGEVRGPTLTRPQWETRRERHVRRGMGMTMLAAAPNAVGARCGRGGTANGARGLGKDAASVVAVVVGD